MIGREDIHLVNLPKLAPTPRTLKHTYNGPSILRPPMGPRKRGLILQVVFK